MHATSSVKIVLAWGQASSRAARNETISAILRTAGLAALAGLLFGALAFGLWVGISPSGDLSASDRGVMDSTY
jgi:hypothetical protein